MIIGVGVDICKISRIAKVLERDGKRFLARLLTVEELQAAGEKQANAAYVAKRWAAKEAVAKALGTGIGSSLSFLDIMLERNNGERPTVTLTGQAAQAFANTQLHLSLSDDDDIAIAYVVAEKIEN